MKEDIGISKPKKDWNKIRIVFKQQKYVVMWKWCFNIVDTILILFQCFFGFNIPTSTFIF